MIKDITIGQYVPGESFIHKLDPRVKLIFSLFYIIILFVVNNFQGYSLIIFFTVFIIYISKIHLRYLYKGLKPLMILILFTTILNIFFTPGQTLVLKLGIINIYKEGLIFALFIVLRLSLLIIGTSILTLTTSPLELTDGLEKLMNPFKKIGLPAHELAMMMSIALRFIPTLLDETDKIMKAQMARGVDFESGGLIKRGRSLIPLLVPLLISSFRRADELATAMEARCYRGGKGRTKLKELKFTKRDYTACVVMIIFYSVCIACEVIW